MQATLCAAILLVAVACVPVAAADIAGNDGWMDLSAAVAKYDIDESFIDTVLDGGVEFTCLGKNEAGQTVVTARFVAWFMYGRTDAVHSVGHPLYDKEKKRRYVNVGCHVALNRQVQQSSSYERFPIDPSLASYRVGGRNPSGGVGNDDRATYPLVAGAAAAASAAGVVPIVPNQQIAEAIAVGIEAFMVSAARPFFRNIKGGYEPQMQRCKVLRVDDATPDVPALIRTDCDSMRGVSGSMLFVRDPASPLRLVAVGMQARMQQILTNDTFAPIDNRPADPDSNASISLAFDRHYNNYPISGDQVFAKVDGLN